MFREHATPPVNTWAERASAAGLNVAEARDEFVGGVQLFREFLATLLCVGHERIQRCARGAV